MCPTGRILEDSSAASSLPSSFCPTSRTRGKLSSFQLSTPIASIKNKLWKLSGLLRLPTVEHKRLIPGLHHPFLPAKQQQHVPCQTLADSYRWRSASQLGKRFGLLSRSPVKQRHLRGWACWQGQQSQAPGTSKQACPNANVVLKQHSTKQY